MRSMPAGDCFAAFPARVVRADRSFRWLLMSVVVILARIAGAPWRHDCTGSMVTRARMIGCDRARRCGIAGMLAKRRLVA
jgi:hypothetical protein